MSAAIFVEKTLRKCETIQNVVFKEADGDVFRLLLMQQRWELLACHYSDTSDVEFATCPV